MDKDVVKNNNDDYLNNIQKDKIELNKKSEYITSPIIQEKSSKLNNSNIPPFKLTKTYKNNKISLEKENNENKCIFSNIEIQKLFNNQDIYKISQNYNDNISKKINNKNININNLSIPNNNKNIIIQNKSLNNDKSLFKISYSDYKNKKELKEQATNTYNNNLILKDINYNRIYSSTPRINSNGNFKKEKNFILENKKFIKTNNPFNKINNYLSPDANMNSVNKKRINYLTQNNNMLITNIEKYSANNIFSNSKYARDILIDHNNIKNNDEIKKNGFKYYNDIYNYNIMQSIMQNRSNFFNMRNVNIFPFLFLNSNNNRSIMNNNKELYINNFFNNINNFSIRELY